MQTSMKMANVIYLILLNLVWIVGLMLVIANGHGAPFRSSIAQDTLVVALIFILDSIFLCWFMLQAKAALKILFGFFHVAVIAVIIYLLSLIRDGFVSAQIAVYIWSIGIVYLWFRVAVNVIKHNAVGNS